MLKFLSKSPSSFLGIDIGTMGIKIVQLGDENGKLKLETYGLLETYDSFELLNNSLRIKNSTSLNNRVSELLSEVIRKSKATAKQAAMSIPIFSTFSALVELPDMSDSEIKSAVPFEARKYIPIPLDEVILGWNVIGRRDDQGLGGLGGKKSKKVQVLLVAISKEIAKRYTQIAKLAGLKVTVLETESFSLARSLIKNGNSQSSDPAVIADIGSRTTNVIELRAGS
jgi:type IV pilus assembly protein PilM